ncbi:hypothetical protein F5144DRAFT_569983 [Chaetomium tenue]|uniref:Uncharacterized protein n=1 Tax=Chaetomium tenue TaxID=1854479 RepID=A0ACB7PEF7_9PEZI|nr:hypothetical protein F5144DRAFT_569983 [Chaetomium globosum]
MAGPHNDAGRGTQSSYAAGNTFTGPGFQNNAPIAQLNQYINETESNEAQWLRHLFITDPRCDKKRLEDAKGGILPAACDWVLRQPTFQIWQDDPHARLLWINSGPGTGKTMAFCHILDELVSELGSEDRLAYFFFEEGSTEAGTASAVLRSLAYMLITCSKPPDKELLIFVGEECDATGTKVLGGPGSWYRLEKIFRRILGGLSRPGKRGTIYLCVDALNECTEDLQNLLKFVVGVADSEDMPRVKWLLTSRWASAISRALNVGGTATRYSMDLDDYQEETSRAMNSYVDHCAEELTKMHGGLGVEEVRKRLRGKAEKGYSFQYMSLLVAKGQQATTPEGLLEIVDDAAEDIAGLYQQTAERIRHLHDQIQRGCLDALTAVATAYRPLHYSELCALSDIHPNEAARSIIRECEPFWAINNNGDAQITNQSAREFLSAKNTLLSSSLEERHHQMFSRSLKTMNKMLYRDMCSLGHPGYPTVDVKPEQRERLAGVGYACEYWIEHLIASGDRGLNVRDATAVRRFLEERFMNWVEAVSLLGNGHSVLLSWSKLVNFLRKIPNMESLVEIAADAQSFIEFNVPSIMAYPLQTYTSALLFAPTQSKIVDLFTHEKPSWVAVGNGMERSRWSPWIRTLTPQARNVVVTKPAAFSSDGNWVAALLQGDGQAREVSYYEVDVWDLRSGICLWTFPGATDCVGFPPQGSRLAVTMDGDMRLWDLTQGCWDDNQILKGLSPIHAAFSPDGIWLAAVAGEPDDKVQMWDWERGDCVLKFGGAESGTGAIQAIAFSSNGLWVATADRKGMSVWDHESGNCLWRNDTTTTTLAFSTITEGIVISANYGTLTAWDWRTDRLVRKLVVKEKISLRETQTPVAISADGSRFAAAPVSMINIWEAKTKRRLQTLEGYEKYVGSLAFSPDGGQLAVGGDWGLKICLTASTKVNTSQEQRDHKGKIKWIKLSDDGKRILSISVDIVRVWDAMTGRCISQIDTCKPNVVPEDDDLLDAALSGNGSRLILVYRDYDPTVWDIDEKGHDRGSIPEQAALACLSFDGGRAALVTVSHEIRVWNFAIDKFDHDNINFSPYNGRTKNVGCIVFSPVASQIAVSRGGAITIWECLERRQKKRQTMVTAKTVKSLCFSHDGQLLLSSYEEEIRVWDVASGHCARIVRGVVPGIGVVGFDALSTRILSNFGFLAVNGQSATFMLLPNDTTPEEQCQRLGFGIDKDKSWVTWGSDRVLWLPPEYRPDSVAVLPAEPSKRLQASLIVLGCYSGRVVFLRFSGQKPPLLGREPVTAT